MNLVSHAIARIVLEIGNSTTSRVVDTGGIVFDDTEDEFADRITAQALVAIDEADVVLMIADGQAGVTDMDQALAKWLRRYCPKLPKYHYA